MSTLRDEPTVVINNRASDTTIARTHTVMTRFLLPPRNCLTPCPIGIDGRPDRPEITVPMAVAHICTNRTMPSIRILRKPIFGPREYHPSARPAIFEAPARRRCVTSCRESRVRPGNLSWEALCAARHHIYRAQRRPPGPWAQDQSHQRLSLRMGHQVPGPL